MSLKEPLMYKSSPKWLCWVYLDTNKHFSPQKSTKLFRTPKKFFLGVKNYIFGKWPQLTLLDEFDIEKSQNFRNMQNIAKFRLIVGLLVPQPSTYE